jgi:hypothetical protein
VISAQSLPSVSFDRAGSLALYSLCYRIGAGAAPGHARAQIASTDWCQLVFGAPEKFIGSQAEKLSRRQVAATVEMASAISRASVGPPSDRHDAQLAPLAAKPQRIFGPNGAVARRLNIDRRDPVVLLAIGCRFRSGMDVIRRRMDDRRPTHRGRARCYTPTIGFASAKGHTALTTYCGLGIDPGRRQDG